jgi:endonuclease YncB( thermonuclease family)
MLQRIHGMNAIRRFLNSSLVGTAVIGCFSLLIFLSLCGILAVIRRPGVLASAPTATATIPIPTKILRSTQTATPILATPTIFILPTNTIPPTKAQIKVEFTATLLANASPESTSVPIQATPARSCVPSGQPQVGKVVDVIDGDTITAQLDGLVVKVKYIGVDAPESVSRLEYLGKEARNRNRELVVGRDVLLYRDVSDRDRFDRLLRYVFVDDKFINYELISQGYASALDEPPDSACAFLLKDVETGVKEQALGIWAPHTPQPELSLATTDVIIFDVNKEGEFVDIQNVGDTAIDLSGWKLVSEQGNEECKLAGIIHAYEIVRVFSGVKQPGFSCGYEKPIWNDTEPDPAVLYDPDKNEVARFP